MSTHEIAPQSFELTIYLIEIFIAIWSVVKMVRCLIVIKCIFYVSIETGKSPQNDVNLDIIKESIGVIWRMIKIKKKCMRI